MVKVAEVVAAALLIAGTAVGVGILGLPVQVGMAGLLPAMVGLSVGLVLMYISGMVIAEAYVQSENKDADFPSLAEYILGKPGKYLVIIGYMIIFWGLLIAYYSAGTSILLYIMPFSLPRWLALLLFFSPITAILFYSFKYVLRFNAVIMILLMASFATLLIICSHGIELERYNNISWSLLPGTLPIILCTLAYQNTIPAICQRFKGDIKQIRYVIISGLALIGLICLLWLTTVIGALPLEGNTSIHSALIANQPATIPLTETLNSHWVTLTGIFFSIAAIATSYISISFGMLRFFQDVLPLKNNNKNVFGSAILVFIPPVIVSLICPNIFLKAMDIVGGVGVVILFGIIPSLMLIKQHQRRSTTLLGFVVLLAFLAILGLEIFRKL